MFFRTILIVNKMSQASPALVKNQIPLNRLKNS